MQRIFILIIVFLIVISGNVLAADNTVKLFFNNKELVDDVSPFLEDDRTLVPIRMVMEAFDYTVFWDDFRRIVTIKSENKTIVLSPDSDIATIDTQKIQLDTKAKIVSDRVFVPIRFVSENFGYNVVWDGTTKSVYINEIKKSNDISITKIKTEHKDEILRIKLQSSAKFEEPATFMLENTDRFVIDINDAVLETGISQLTPSKSYVVSNIRFSQYKNEPNIVRLVIDLKTKTEIKTGYDNDTYVIEVSDSKDLESKIITTPRTGKLVVLDPGHGGAEPGSSGTYNGKKILEKDINLYIGNKVLAILKEKGIDVLPTRTTDKTVSLQERVEIANEANADLFVSIHNNAFEDPSAKGTLTLYAYDEPKEGQTVSDKQVAAVMQKELIKGTGGYNRNLLKNPNIYVTRKTTMPALLCECLFMTNAEDIKVLADNSKLDKIAKSIADGIVNCLAILP